MKYKNTIRYQWNFVQYRQKQRNINQKIFGGWLQTKAVDLTFT